MAATSVSVAITGSGGAGAITAGALLLEAAGRSGWYGLMTRSVGPQIRGGEAAAMVRLAPSPVETHPDRFDLLVALDWRNVERFADEIPLGPASLVIADEEAGPVPAKIAASGARATTLPLAKLAREIPGGRANVAAIGVVGALIGLPAEALSAAVDATLSGKGVGGTTSAQILDAGRAAAAGLPADLGIGLRLAAPLAVGDRRWLFTGNQASALGALHAGIRFVAMYPITPATDMLEWMAPQLTRLGGELIQAEDEIAAINMCLGASYGGVPSLTATSGPGLALMAESIGLAVAAELPMVIVNVMRGGPSTGIPTKSEQSDLDIALHGLHGDAPHLVLAALSVSDCVFATRWAVELSERLQVPAIVLTDQFLGQAKTVADRPPPAGAPATRLLAEPGAVPQPYRRYAVTADGISPMALPGMPGLQHTPDGLEHTPRGTPSSQAADHRVQLDKRQTKLDRLDPGPNWAEIDGDGDLALVTWGSCRGAVREAAARLNAAGQPVRVIAMRLLSPPQPGRLATALAGVRRILVIEQSHSAQFLRYLRSYYDLPGEIRSLHRAGPLPIRPGDVLDALGKWS